MKSSYYFLQRSKLQTETHRSRYVALAVLFVAILFAVVMHLPKPEYVAALHPVMPQAQGKIVTPDLKTTTVIQNMPYGTSTVTNPSLPAGTQQVTTPGVDGAWTLTYQTSIKNGKESPRRLVSIVATKKPVTEIITIGTGPAR